ncbi:GntR family transcriptional regulator [Ideonella azotifigens]|uniref:GntR family transcriptional regulator n=1 Tax=Ideonella azotifigens TaxID=513160 RepID=UPI002174DD9F
MRVEELSRQYGQSSSPLREALNRLVHQGLVRSIDNRGFRVAPISIQGIADLTRVRLLIETETLRDALQNGSEDWEGDVVASFHGLSSVEKKLTEGPLVLDDK